VQSRAERRPGFSLLEAVVAMAIVGITAVSALAAVASEMRTAERARTALEADALATFQLTRFNMLTAEELQFLPDSIAQGTFDPPFDSYSWVTTAEAVVDEEYLHRVSLSIVWAGGSRTVRTMLYRIPATGAIAR
jgi:prepilin-type N-terminal cleavage/methylation domain-containing protein